MEIYGNCKDCGKEIEVSEGHYRLNEKTIKCVICGEKGMVHRAIKSE